MPLSNPGYRAELPRPREAWSCCMRLDATKCNCTQSATSGHSPPLQGPQRERPCRSVLVGSSQAVPQAGQLPAPEGQGQRGAEGPWHEIQQGGLGQAQHDERQHRGCEPRGVAREYGHKVAGPQSPAAEQVVPQQVGGEQPRQHDVPKAQDALGAQRIADGRDAENDWHGLARAPTFGHLHHDALLEEQRRDEDPEDVVEKHEGQQECRNPHAGQPR
mmetsp:Transcript_43535/g.134890  ORF Transcript_43535/g.134890 Transcript_43535/m.134890 type:complete len:217 (+) Transcript_43535:2-652(+)